MKIKIHEIKKSERLFVTFHIVDKEDIVKEIKIDYSLDTNSDYIEEEAKNYLKGYIRFLGNKEKNKESDKILEKATETVEKLKNLVITQ